MALAPVPASLADGIRICPSNAALLSRDSVLCTEGHLTFETLARKHHLEHRVLNASAGEIVKASVFHIQGENNDHQRLQGWIQDYHGVATHYLPQHLPHYLGWFRWNDQNKSIFLFYCRFC
jgi:hypothetical protein